MTPDDVSPGEARGRHMASPPHGFRMGLAQRSAESAVTARPARRPTATTPRNRLVKHDDGHGTLSDYSLEEAGNILSETQTGRTGSSTSYSYSGNQLKTRTVAGVTGNCFYDPDGNLDCITLAAGTSADCALPSGASKPAALVANHPYDLSRLPLFRSFTSAGTAQDSVHSHHVARPAPSPCVRRPRKRPTPRGSLED